MLILNQDKNEIFTLGNIYTEEKFSADGIWMGWNVLGYQIQKSTNDVVLGTYDEEEEAEQVVAEIFKLYKTGKTYYAMSEPALSLDEMEES